MFYMILEKVQGFAQGKYDVNVTTAQIGQEYEEKRSDAWERIESMSITKRIVSTCASVYRDIFVHPVILPTTSLSSSENDAGESPELIGLWWLVTERSFKSASPDA